MIYFSCGRDSSYNVIFLRGKATARCEIKKKLLKNEKGWIFSLRTLNTFFYYIHLPYTNLPCSSICLLSSWFYYYGYYYFITAQLRIWTLILYSHLFGYMNFYKKTRWLIFDLALNWLFNFFWTNWCILCKYIIKMLVIGKNINVNDSKNNK